MPKFCANLSMLYGEHSFLERFAAARRDGFAAIEYMFPYAYAKEELAQALQRSGLTQVMHNLPAGNWEKGERGVACQPERVAEFRAGVAQARAYASRLGCKMVNCLIGIPSPGGDPARVRATVVGNLGYAAAELKKAGIRLLIEPVNDKDVPGFWLSRVGEAMALIRDVGSDNLFIQYDVYHQSRMEGDIAATYLRCKDRIAHVQVADNPGRHEPGSGEINYPYLFRVLDEAGYPGWIGCEYKPAAGTSAGLGWVAAYLGHDKQRSRAEGKA